MFNSLSADSQSYKPSSTSIGSRYTSEQQQSEKQQLSIDLDKAVNTTVQNQLHNQIISLLLILILLKV